MGDKGRAALRRAYVAVSASLLTFCRRESKGAPSCLQLFETSNSEFSTRCWRLKPSTVAVVKSFRPLVEYATRRCSLRRHD